LNIDLVTGYPFWFIFLCLLLGAGCAAILYYKETRNEFSRQLKWIMAILRTLVISFIAFLLLNPLVKTINHFGEKPVIIFAQDNSSSIKTNADSNYYTTQYVGQVNDFLEKIGGSYTLDKYTFGETVDEKFEINFQDNLTDISGLFDEIEDKYSHQNVGALIVASDGIYNRGINPVYSSEKFDFPIYTIALGDTNHQKDVILTKVNYNRIAYLGNDFPLEVIITAHKCSNQTVELTVSKGDAVLFKKAIFIRSEDYFETVKLQLNASEPGIQRYHVQVSTVENEISTENNLQDIFIDVLDGKQKILLLSQSPDPDITAIKQAIQENKNYEMEDFIISDFNNTALDYNLVILHGLPSLKNQIADILSKIDVQNLPVLYIVTQNTNLPLLNKRNAGIALKNEKIIYNEAQASYNDKFSLFRLSEKVLQATSYFPPLVSPYGSSVIQPSASVLFSQKIGTVATQEPLYLFNENQQIKSGFIMGSGIWKWRMINFAREGNHEAFDEIINKTIQFLSVKVDRSFFRVYSKNNYYENEDVEFDAELYNDNYELINDAEVSLTIMDSKGNKYPFVFNRTSQAYYLNSGKLPFDRYTYSASVNRGDKFLSDKGEFTVSSLNVEKTNTVANHNILYNLAINRGGDMVYPNDLDALVKMISEREDIKTIVYSQKRYTEILNFPLILILLILLVSMEWFVRKRAGAY
jgi:hypothetical protein